MKFINFIKTHLIIILIVLVGLFLRTYNLSEFPVGLHGDEASIGYNAYSLLKTARDQNGNFLPIAIDQFGDFRPAGYHYLDIPFVALLGLNPFAVRLPAALFGTLSIIVLYLLLNELFQIESISLIGAGLLAILPWDINISRASSEGTIASFFVTLGIYFFIKGIKRQKSSFYLLFSLSALSFLISFFFYHAPRFVVPILLPLIIILNYFSYKPSKQKVIASIIFLAVVLLGFFFFLTSGKGTGRVSEVSIFNIPGGATTLKTAMDEEGTLNPILTRFYDNKLFFYGRFFLTFYSEHLSGDFLFVNNGFPIRYKIPFTGNLYLIEAPFLLFGFATLLTEGIKKRKWFYLVPIAWLLIAPIPAGLTWEDLPNVERASLMIPALIMIIAFGFYEILILSKKYIKIGMIILSSILLLQGFLYFYHNYFWRLKVHEPWNRSAAESTLIYSVLDLSKKYPKIVMTTQNNNNLIFYLFYTKFDPLIFQKMGSPREKDGLKFNNVTYVYNECPMSGSPDNNFKGDSETLFIQKTNCSLPKNAEIINTIANPDGTPAFELVKLNKFVE